ncbi:YcgN family cysteine cluster protein [Aurantiacibacter xanthus]|uniref:YcgN family cysteine cluster protein n=1 Tax=Aurantiacibacter xanthus TaxID=1784712 RepID=A0A3A1P4W6_9SPHN|nr:YcgN family cysteine cluster protein [Aurantiacibacter xanthus]RIV88343.1 YcgN family cysteine cluster protein [Aurantiacibacter xanthus]
MGALRDRFWELPLASLSREEWEALCDGCGRCCLHKLEDEDSGAILETNVACKLLDTGTARCRDYAHRKAFVPDCMRLTPRLVAQVPWLPESCAYKRRADNRPIPQWHPLLTGSPEAMIASGASVAGRCISENDAGPIEHHIVDWPEE